MEAEYRSAARTQHLTLWLIQIGASPDLVRAGLRIAGDETDHAELSHQVFVEAGGEGGPSLVRESLALDRRHDAVEPLEHDVARACVEIFCLGETVAVPLFKELRASCTVPVARTVLDRVLKDEARHRDFGWTMLTWLMEEHATNAKELSGDLRVLIERELPAWFQRLRAAYAPPSKGVAEPIVSADERAWGLMPVSMYCACVEKTLVRDWVPRFSKLGFDAAAAWAGHVRG